MPRPIPGVGAISPPDKGGPGLDHVPFEGTGGRILGALVLLVRSGNEAGMALSLAWTMLLLKGLPQEKQSL